MLFTLLTTQMVKCSARCPPQRPLSRNACVSQRDASPRDSHSQIRPTFKHLTSIIQVPDPYTDTTTRTSSTRRYSNLDQQL
jgi:hypothetical protein